MLAKHDLILEAVEVTAKNFVQLFNRPWKVKKLLSASTLEFADMNGGTIKTDKELDELIKHRNIIIYVKAQRMSWFGHINRMPETSIVKRINNWKPFTGRPAGRPKSRWEDDVRNNLKKMKLMTWAEQVQDRLKWKDIVEEAKTLSEL